MEYNYPDISAFLLPNQSRRSGVNSGGGGQQQQRQQIQRSGHNSSLTGGGEPVGTQPSSSRGITPMRNRSANNCPPPQQYMFLSVGCEDQNASPIARYTNNISPLGDFTSARVNRNQTYHFQYNEADNVQMENPPYGISSEQEALRLNSAALRRIDSNFLRLVGTTSQAAIYDFRAETQAWAKTDIVGCLFLYERQTSPKYGFVIMNRKGANNFVLTFGEDAQVQLQCPYLLIRCKAADGSLAIHCIWFYDRNDCERFNDTLQNMTFRRQLLRKENRTESERSNSVQSAQSGLSALLSSFRKQTIPPPPRINKILTVEELESQFHCDQAMPPPFFMDSSSLMRGLPGRSNQKTKFNIPIPPVDEIPSLMSISVPVPIVPVKPIQPQPATLQQLLNMGRMENTRNGTRGNINPRPNSTNRLGYRNSPEPSGPTAMSDNCVRNRNQMRTVEQLERDMARERPESDRRAQDNKLSIELKMMMGIPI